MGMRLSIILGVLLTLAIGADNPADAQWSQPNYGPLLTGATGLTATGSTQKDAITLPNQVNIFTTVPSGSGTQLPAVTPISIGAAIEITNNDTNTLNVYPGLGDSIYNGARNAPITVAGSGGYVRLVMLTPPSASTHVWQTATPVGVPASGGTFTGPINFGGSGISTGLPTNGVYLNSANQCGTVGPAIALAGKDGAPVLQFMSSSETPTSHDDSTALGYGALAAWNCLADGPVTAIGSNTLNALTTGNHDTALGYGALTLIQTSQFNTALGIDAGRYLTDTSNYNTLIGQQTGTFGSSATAGVGTITDGTYVGFSAGDFAGGSYNTAVGAGALDGLSTAPLTSNQNTAIGGFALAVLGGASAANNTAVGYGALALQTTGPANTVVGEAAGSNVTTGGSNSLFGQGVGSAITTASGNILIGVSSNSNVFSSSTSGAIGIGQNMKPGTNDTCIGIASCHSTTHDNNTTTAVGYQAGLNVTQAAQNTLLGYNAGSILTTGGPNVIVGGLVASTTLQTGANNVIIGTNASCDAATAATANTIEFCAGSTPVWLTTGAGTPATSASSVAGSFAVGAMATATGSFVCATAASALTLEATTCVASDERLKNNIDSLTPDMALARVLALPFGHDFTFKEGYGAAGLQEGFFAQEVQKTRPDLVTKSAPTELTPDGTLSVNYPALGIEAPLAIKALQSEIDTQRMWLILLSLIVLALGASQVMLWRRQ